MRVLRLAPILLLSLALVPMGVCAVESVSVSPQNADVGDTITVEIVAAPNEVVSIDVDFDGYLPVSEGEYYAKFSAVELTSGSNRLEVTVSEIVDVDLGVKYGFVKYVTRENTDTGSVSLSRVDAPVGSYDITVSGGALPGAGRVYLELILELSVIMDGKGEYLYELDTGSILEGTFSINVAGILRQVIVDEPFIPLPSFVNPPITVIPDDSSLSIIEELEGGDLEQLSVLLDYNDTAAASILEQLSLPQGVLFVSEYNASSILNQVSVNHTWGLVSALDNATSGSVLNSMEPEKVGQVLLYGNSSTGVSLVLSIIRDNITSAAVRIEHAVKNRNNESLPELLKDKTDKLSELFRGLDASSLVPLFEAIALLPHTPSTVADLLEIVGYDSASNIVNHWLEYGDLELLETVLSYVEPDFCSELYFEVDRTSLFSLLSNQTIILLPESHTIKTDLIIPVSPVEHEEVSIVVSARNDGDEPGHKTIDLHLDEELVASYWAVLFPGDQVEYNYSQIFHAGEYVLELDDEFQTLVVGEYLTPSDIQLTDVYLSQSDITEGDPLYISYILSNLGESSGEYSLNVTIDSDSFLIDTIQLEGLSSTENTVFLPNLEEGTRTISINGEKYQVVVSPEPSQVPFGLGSILLGVFVVLCLLRLTESRGLRPRN